MAINQKTNKKRSIKVQVSVRKHQSHTWIIFNDESPCPGEDFSLRLGTLDWAKRGGVYCSYLQGDTGEYLRIENKEWIELLEEVLSL